MIPSLVTPVRTQPDGDKRCIAYAVAAAIETAICRQRQTVNGVPEISVDDVFQEGGAVVGSIAGIVRAVERGVVDVTCRAPNMPRCADPGAHLWRAKLRPIGGDRKKRVDLMREILQAKGPIVSLFEIFSNFGGFSGSGIYSPVRPSAGFHAVCIVGEESTAGTSHGLWVAKNSMGSAWGDSGFFRMAWREPLLQPEAVVFSVEDVKQ